MTTSFRRLAALTLLIGLLLPEYSLAEKPNILVIMTDDQGRWSLNDYDSRLETPNISYLAEQGVRFDQAISPTPVCSAARASFFTGLTASQHGVHDFLSDSDSQGVTWLEGQTLLSEILSDNGYTVGLFGKWHATTQSWEPVRGFDKWLTYDERAASWINQYQHSGTVHFSSDGDAITHTGVQAHFLSEQAIEFIDARGDKPFAAFVNYVEPHFPFAGLPERLVSKYRPLANDIVAAGDFAGLEPSAHTSPETSGHVEKMAQYLAAVALVDEQVGRLLDALMGRELLNNTLIVFTSDHGHMTGQYGLYGKGNASVPQNFYEDSINIPLIISGPKAFVAPAQVRNDFVNLYDIFPTILETISDDEALAAYQGPGKSLLPLLKGERFTRFRSVQIAEMGNGRMVHDGSWKLVRYYQRDNPTAIEHWYDLAHPLGERWPAPAPSADQQHYLKSALDAFFQQHEVTEHSGKRIWDLPKHNGNEIWRRQTQR